MLREELGYIRAYVKIANLNPWLFALNFITAVLYKAADTARPFLAAMIIKGLTEQDAHATYFAIALFAVVYLFFRGSLFLNWRAYSWNMIDCYHNLQEKIFHKLITVDGNFTKKVNRGKLLNVVDSDLFDIGEMNDEISEFFTTPFQILFVIIISLQQNIPITILMILSSIIYVKIRTKADRKYNYYWWRSAEGNDRFSNFINQILAGLQETKVFNMLGNLHRHLDSIQRYYDKNYRLQRKNLTLRDASIHYAEYGFRAAILLICILLMASGHMELDILVMLYSYHQQLITITGDFTDATINIRLDNAAVKRVGSILNYHGESEVEFGNLNLDHISGGISFKNVSLSINRKTILKNLNFKIKPREFVAIVGYPGSGKTKLFDLLLRINQPTTGTITLDGVKINEFSQEVYAANVAVANQIPFIFNTSIRKNLNFVDTNIKRQIEACKIAGIHDFIETLPMGYNTILRENGGNISGGQRQMISIARTILTDAEIILLDDVSTSLDPDTAKLIPRLINRIKNDRTIIMITKKPELMKEADRIMVLDHGRIVDSGTHEKLLERSSLYRSLQNIRSLENMEGGQP